MARRDQRTAPLFSEERQNRQHEAGRIRQYLQGKGWRLFRDISGLMQSFRGRMSVGENGMPEIRAVRYMGGGVEVCLRVDLHVQETDWTRAERERGAVVIHAATLEDFLDAYHERFRWINDQDSLDHVRRQIAATIETAGELVCR